MDKAMIRTYIKRTLRVFSVLLLGLCANAFAQTYAAGACTMVPSSETCVDSTPCKTLANGAQVCLAGVSSSGAYNISETCWKYTYSYACKSDVGTNTCGDYENNSKCQILTTTCTDKDPETGVCDSWNYTYQCRTKDAETEQQVQCTAGLVAQVDNPDNSNTNFATAAVALEISREMTVYSASGQTTIFSGVKETCAKGYAGIKNCCKSSPGGQNNTSVVASLGVAAAYSAVKYVGQQAVDTVSPYVFDAMFSSDMFGDGLDMATSLLSSSSVVSNGGELATNFAANGMTLSAYGFTFGTGTFVAEDAMSGTTLLAGGEGGFVAFNPYVLAAQLALQYVMSLMACTQEEQMLGMHKGSNLSVYVKTECSNKVLGVCLEYTDTYCSFNSVLARIINQQGKAQLGLDFSDCSGLTIQQVTDLDFTKLDLSEFTSLMVEQAQKGLVTSSSISNSYQSVMSTTTSGSSQSSAYGTAYPTDY